MSTDGAYEQLSSEYYDVLLHPTSANFREASRNVLTHWGSLLRDREWICEVGAGSSLVCEVLEREQDRFNNSILTDFSHSMLAWSVKWKGRGAHLVVCEAETLPLPSNSMSALVSILGDCYDTLSFWKEAFRVIRPGGVVLFTTPSHEWAAAFRGDREPWVAEFLTRDGRKVGVPSFVRPVDEERTLIERAGLTVKETLKVPMSELRTFSVSPKLSDVLRASDPVVVGYMVAKSQ